VKETLQKQDMVGGGITEVWLKSMAPSTIRTWIYMFNGAFPDSTFRASDLSSSVVLNRRAGDRISWG
jgi:hypothetical protein